jgi:hypothetical protein
MLVAGKDTGDTALPPWGGADHDHALAVASLGHGARDLEVSGKKNRGPSRHASALEHGVLTLMSGTVSIEEFGANPRSPI